MGPRPWRPQLGARVNSARPALPCPSRVLSYFQFPSQLGQIPFPGKWLALPHQTRESQSSNFLVFFFSRMISCLLKEEEGIGQNVASECKPTCRCMYFLLSFFKASRVTIYVMGKRVLLSIIHYYYSILKCFVTFLSTRGSIELRLVVLIMTDYGL